MTRYMTGGILPTYDASAHGDWLAAARAAWRFARRTGMFAMAHLPGRFTVIFCRHGWDRQAIERAGLLDLTSRPNHCIQWKRV